MTMDTTGVRKVARSLPNDRRIVEREWSLSVFNLVSCDGREFELGSVPT